MSVKKTICWLSVLQFTVVFMIKGIYGDGESIVKGKPRYIDGSGNSSLTLDNDNYWIATFSCKFVGGNSINISWHYEGHRVPTDDPGSRFEVQYNVEKLYTESTLRVKRFTDQFDVQYSCLAINHRGYDSRDLWLEYSPSLEVDLLDHYYSPGDTITAKCISFPDSELFWQLSGDKSLRNDPNFSHTTDDNNTVSVIELVLSEHDNDATIRCCNQGRNPLKRSTPLCRSFVVKVSLSENNDNICSLSCTFKEFPPVLDSNKTITWQYVEIVPGDTDLELSTALENFTNEITDDGFTVTNFQISHNDLKSGKYQCLMTNDNTSVSHTFIIDEHQTSISIVNISRLNISEMSTAALQCVFTTVGSISNAYWIVEDVGASNGWTIINNSTENSYEIEVNEKEDNFWILTLYVRQFTSYEVGRYSCVISNSLSTVQSESLLLEWLPEFSRIELVVTPENVTTGEFATATCSVTSGVIPNQINWRLLSEFDTEYNIEIDLETSDNVHFSELKFTAEWKSNVVFLKCGISFDTAPSVPIFSLQAIQIYYEPRLLEVKECNIDAIEVYGGCRIACTTQADVNYKLLEESWIYFGENESQSVALDRELINNPVPHRVKTVYLMKTFSAGVYQCRVNYQNVVSGQNVTVNHEFKMEPDQIGVPINGEVHYGGACVSDNQCAQATEKAVCNAANHQCACPEGSFYNNTPNHRCIVGVPLNGRCANHEECLYMKMFSACTNSTCKCQDTYYYDENKTACVVHDTSVAAAEKVSTGSIIGILLLVLIVVAVAAAVISTSLKKHRKKQRRLKAHQAANIKLEDKGPANSPTQRMHANDTDYWYNPNHQTVRLTTSNVSRTS
ncbi:hypothetical protein CHUAL_008669 [Chamberlinius hualienensis]